MRVRVLTTAVLVAAWATPAAAQAQFEAERWNIFTSTGATYTDNLTFASDDGIEDVIGTLSTGLSWVRVSDRTRLTLSGVVSYRKFFDLEQFDGGQLGLGGSAFHALTPRLNLSSAFSFSTGFNPFGSLGEQVLLPQVDVRAYTGNAGLAFELTPETQATLTFDATFIDYRTELIFDGTLLPSPVQGPREELGFGLPEQPEGQPPLVDDPLDAVRLLLAAILAEGVIGTELDINTYHVGFGLAHTFGTRTRGALNLGHRWIDSGQAATLGDGRQFNAGASLNQVVSPTWNLALSYGFQANDAQQPPIDTHNALLGVTKEFNPRVQAAASIGVGLFDVGAPGAENSLSLIGSFNLRRRGDRNAFVASYNRSAVQALGFGRNYVTDALSASYNRILDKKLSAGLFAAYQNSRDSFEDGVSFDTAVAGVSLARRIHRRSSLRLSYSWRRLVRSGLPAAQGSTVNFAFSYGRTFK